MERGNNQLTLDDDAMAAAEGETRRLLARYGQPQVMEPPAALAGRVIDALSEPSSRPASTLRRFYAGIGLICGCVALALGAWGVLIDSSGPAKLFGDLSGGISELILILTLAAKPLINLLMSAGATALVMIVASLGGSWLWWELLRRELAVSPETSA
ncbi:MAG: hypothetical protein WCF99_10300 [Chloroflexales bacterium]